MKISTGLKLTACAATLVVFGVNVPASQASDVTSLETKFATDVAYAGVGGMRNQGTGEITLAGVSGTVTEALLFWHGPTSSDDPNANAAVTFNGAGVVGTNLGASSDNCWGFGNSQAYRADVTSLVPGNGTYALADFTKEGVEVNGAQLVVFYDDGNPANNRDVVMFNGNDSNIENPFDALGWNVSLPGINYTSGTASMDLVVSDGQTFPDGSLELNGGPFQPGPQLFDGDSVPLATGSESQSLWDQKTYDVTANLTPGLNTITLTHQAIDGGDCLSMIYAAVNLPAGAAPDQPPTTTTTEAPPTTVEPAPEPQPQPQAQAPAPARVNPRFTG